MLAKRLDLADYIPALVVCDVFLDVFHNPEEQLVSVFQTLDEFIHSLLLHLIVVESDAEVGGQVQFSSQVSQYTLEEGIDGLHMKIVVVVDEQSECRFCILSDLCFRQMWQCLMYLLQILV